MVDSAEERVLLADHSKLGARSFVHICELEKFNELITDGNASDSFLERVRDKGVAATTVSDCTARAPVESREIKGND